MLDAGCCLMARSYKTTFTAADKFKQWNDGIWTNEKQSRSMVVEVKDFE